MDEALVDIVRTDARRKLHDGHAEMRSMARAHGVDALNWRPGPDTNSAAVLVAHTLDGERAIVAAVAGIAVDRDREAQFAVRITSPGDLEALIDRLEVETDGYLDHVTGARMAMSIERTTGTWDGLGWLMHVIAHSREHIGQASLTLQLFDQTTSATS